MIESYGYTSCTSCRKTDAQLKASGVEFTSRDFFRTRFTREELAGLFARAGLTPSQVLSKRSKVYRARTDEIDAMSEDQLLDAMLDEPTLLRRPIVIGPGGTVIGHNSERLAALIET